MMQRYINKRNVQEENSAITIKKPIEMNPFQSVFLYTLFENFELKSYEIRFTDLTEAIFNRFIHKRLISSVL